MQGQRRWASDCSQAGSPLSVCHAAQEAFCADHVCSCALEVDQESEEEEDEEDVIVTQMTRWLDANPLEVEKLRSIGRTERKIWLLAEKWVDASQRGALPRKLQKAYQKEQSYNIVFYRAVATVGLALTCNSCSACVIECSAKLAHAAPYACRTSS